MPAKPSRASHSSTRQLPGPGRLAGLNIRPAQANSSPYLVGQRDHPLGQQLLKFSTPPAPRLAPCPLTPPPLLLSLLPPSSSAVSSSCLFSVLTLLSLSAPTSVSVPWLPLYC